MKLKEALNSFPNLSNLNNNSSKIKILPKVKPKLLTKLYSEIMNNFRTNCIHYKVQNETNIGYTPQRIPKSTHKKYGKISISIKEKKIEPEYQNNSQRILSSIGNLNHGNSSPIFQVLFKPNSTKALQNPCFKDQKKPQIQINTSHKDHYKLINFKDIDLIKKAEKLPNNSNSCFNSIDSLAKLRLKREEISNSILNYPLRTIQEKSINVQSAAHFTGLFKKFQERSERRNKLGNVVDYYAYSLRGQQSNGKEKVNQDSYLYKHNMFGILGFWAFGIFDGHGYEGEKISNLVKQKLCRLLK